MSLLQNLKPFEPCTTIWMRLVFDMNEYWVFVLLPPLAPSLHLQQLLDFSSFIFYYYFFYMSLAWGRRLWVMRYAQSTEITLSRRKKPRPLSKLIKMFKNRKKSKQDSFNNNTATLTMSRRFSRRGRSNKLEEQVSHLVSWDFFFCFESSSFIIYLILMSLVSSVHP